MKGDPICLLGLALYFATLAFAQTAAPLAIVDGNVVDVMKGETRGHQTVVIADGRITGTGSSDAVSVPTQAIRIPGEGRYLRHPGRHLPQCRLHPLEGAAAIIGELRRA